jgi:ABC-type Na+ efflux pump permease subunit
MKRTWVVMRKEWREAFRGGKTIWIGTIAIPLILLGASLFQLFSVSDLRAVSPEELPQVVGVLLLIPLLYFMMFPLVIPHQIAIYAIMSEKEQKSLEPLLATPLRTSELFLAKMLASVLPALSSPGQRSRSFSLLSKRFSQQTFWRLPGNSSVRYG